MSPKLIGFLVAYNSKRKRESHPFNTKPKTNPYKKPSPKGRNSIVSKFKLPEFSLNTKEGKNEIE
jgi:hypothetical protein